jgi:hypothetical protein
VVVVVVVVRGAAQRWGLAAVPVVTVEQQRSRVAFEEKERVPDGTPRHARADTLLIVLFLLVHYSDVV